MLGHAQPIMFKVLRKMILGLLVVITGLIAYHYLSIPAYRRGLAQKAIEVKEELGSAKKPAWSGSAVVVDTLKGDWAVLDTETSHRVVARLAGIDAPEMPFDYARKGQPLAEESRQYLASLVKGKMVHVEILGTDETKRPLVLLTLDGALINAKVVEAGFAEAAKETAEAIPAKQRHTIENAELTARQGRLGIWGLTNYIRPVEYRIRQDLPAGAQFAR